MSIRENITFSANLEQLFSAL